MKDQMNADLVPCGSCGKPHAKCTAHSKRTGEPCQQKRMKGQRVCRMHGGKSLGARERAAERLAAANAEVAARSFGLPVEVDPHTALLQELHRTAGEVAWLGEIVAGLERGDAVWGKTREKVGGDDAGVTSEAGLNVWVRTWQAQRKHLAEVAKACVGAGIEERRIRLAEAQGQVLVRAINGILDRLELSAVQRGLVPVVVPEVLRELGPAAEGGAA